MVIKDFKKKLHLLSTDKLIKLRDVADDDLTEKIRDLNEASDHLRGIIDVIKSRRGQSPQE